MRLSEQSKGLVDSVLRSDYTKRYRYQWNLKRIKRFPRRRPFVTNILGPPLRVVDSLSFYYSCLEIFDQKIYDFTADHPSPRIIDGGSNIGLSIIFFKRRFPRACIIGFEPDPTIFEALQFNVESFKLGDVTLVNAALWNEDTDLEFFCEGADAGRIVQPHTGSQSHRVRARRLRTFLLEPLDLLKLDIEGAEVDVLVDCADCLHNVSKMFVEYHSFAGKTQRLDELLSVLRQADFRLQIVTQFAAPQPLKQQPTHLDMDLQLNIFAYRE